MTEESQSEDLKPRVRDFWDAQSCDTQVAKSTKFSRDYFEEIERFRYFDQPFIHSFAQFTRYRGKKVLEVGVGAGTDFIQWLRAGAYVHGVDLTNEAVTNTRQRVAVYELPPPEGIQVADAEDLPFPSNTFDLGYSFGVLHHSPNTEKAIRELVRVVKPGGEVKMMLYNRHSIYAFNLWVKHALLKAKPWKSLRWVLWNYMESVGTKGYTRKELARMLSDLRLRQIAVNTEITAADYLSASAFPLLNSVYRSGLRLAGMQFAWHPADYVVRVNAPDTPAARSYPAGRANPAPVSFTGNRLGFFHCIRAVKPD
jgi:ubiquinone/menaquinone biosynthesis C-methylase UbiE